MTFIETESKTVVIGVGGGGNGELLLNGYRVSVWGHENILEIDSGDSCTTLWIYLMPLKGTLKNG